MTHSSQERNKRDSQNDSTSYRSILKGTSIFGGVQIFMILINLIRGKFVAMFLGPEGMGISSLFASSSNTIVKASSLGLNLAIVKEVARHSDNPHSITNLYSAITVLLRSTAILGAIICICLSKYLSELSFNSSEYAWQYVLLGIAVFFTISGNGKLSLLQGLQEKKKLARASIIGALTGLFTGVPLYVFWGNKGIVPAMTILSFTTYLCYSLSTRRLTSLNGTRGNDKWIIIRKLISLGIILVAGDLIGTLCTYIINIFIRMHGDLDTVGLYQAANSITNQYAGVVFSALALDYLPRLSKIVGNNKEMCQVINRQSEIVALLIVPIAILVITTAPLVINILLTDSFNTILPLLRWMALGIALRGLQFPLGYVTFANDNKKIFFMLEGIFTNVMYLLTSILFFYYFGLLGLGYAIVAESIISLIVYAAVNNHLYSYKFSRRVTFEFIFGILMSSLCLAVSFLDSAILSYGLMISLSITSCVYSSKRIFYLLKEKNNVCS